MPFTMRGYTTKRVRALLESLSFAPSRSSRP